MKNKYSKIYYGDEMLEEKDLRESMKAGLSRPTRLRSCKAIVYHTIDNEFIVLQSYNTIVAFIDLETREAFDILRTKYGYTAISAQHISKFFKDYGQEIERIYRTYEDEKGNYYLRLK